MKLRTIKMRKGSTPQSLFDECQKLFACQCWTGLDDIKSDRTTEKSYTIQFKDSVEADEDLKNLSANDCKDKGIIGITLEERLQMELDYFKETGKHLDIKNITLCTGSRYSDGGVPCVFWGDGGMHVSWHSPDYRHDDWRPRQAVSKTSPLKTLTLENKIIEIDGIKYKLTKV